MITNKDIILESPLNSNLNINDTLLLNLNYKEEKKDDNKINRNSTYLIKKNESIFNKVIKNNCLEDEELFEFPMQDLYREFILNRNESQDSGEENLDELIENMKQKNTRLEQQIMKLNKDIIVKKSTIPNFEIDPEDEKTLKDINNLLQNFIDENLNLNL